MSIGIKMIKNGFEDATFKDSAIMELATALGDLRSGAAKNKWRLGTENATFALKEIGCKAAENGLILNAEVAVGGLKRVDPLDDGGKDINGVTVRALLCLGAAMQKYSPDRVGYVIEHIRKLVTDAGLDRYVVRRCGKDCVSDYPHLQSSFEEFKRQYDNDSGVSICSDDAKIQQVRRLHQF